MARTKTRTWVVAVLASGALLVGACGKDTEQVTTGGRPAPSESTRTTTTPATTKPAITTTGAPTAAPAPTPKPTKPTSRPTTPTPRCTTIDLEQGVATGPLSGGTIESFRCVGDRATVLLRSPSDAPSAVELLRWTGSRWIFERECHADILSLGGCLGDLPTDVGDQLALVGEALAPWYDPAVTSVVTPESWRSECASPARHVTDEGLCVARIQWLVDQTTGAELWVDGRFGPRTDDAVRAFQAAMGLEPDGYVGPATWRALVDVSTGVLPPPEPEPEPEPEPIDRCPGEPSGSAFFASADELRAALLGPWLLCSPPSVFGTWDDLGIEFRSDGRFAKLGGTPEAPMPMTGWGNEGTYEIIDTSDMNGPGSYQVNLQPDGLGTWITQPMMSSDLRYLRLPGYPNWEADYRRVP